MTIKKREIKYRGRVWRDFPSEPTEAWYARTTWHATFKQARQNVQADVENLRLSGIFKPTDRLFLRVERCISTFIAVDEVINDE